jgi:uncharacterized protein YbaR (Trm112 family)/SAM-dependent methyltransferase
MRPETLDVLRCPYCGGRLSLVESLYHRRTAGVAGRADEIHDGILGCHCCIFPVVDGIPVLHLLPAATAARDQIQAGRADLARRTMFGLENDQQAEVFDAVASSTTATYRETVDALGPNFEGGYFLYRFSDPTYIVAQSVVRAVAKTVLGPSTGSGRAARRAIDICGGSGHVTRSLLDLSSTPPVLADLYFAKVWLARRFTAPGCEPVCCDGNAPMPFARGAFGFAMCTDAFMYIWTKRQFVGEMERLVDAGGAVLIGHTHNERTWSPSHGQPLSPEGYADLFETLEPRIFGEAGLFDDVVSGGPLDLSRRDSADTLNSNPALTIIASRDPRVFARHPLETPAAAGGEFRINPLYTVTRDGPLVRLRLGFPSDDYEQEYGSCRRYLPEELTLDGSVVASLETGRVSGELVELVRRKVIVDLPKRYY